MDFLSHPAVVGQLISLQVPTTNVEPGAFRLPRQLGGIPIKHHFIEFEAISWQAFLLIWNQIFKQASPADPKIQAGARKLGDDKGEAGRRPGRGAGARPARGSPQLSVDYVFVPKVDEGCGNN